MVVVAVVKGNDDQSLNQNRVERRQRRNVFNRYFWGFLGGTVVENLPANAGDKGSSPGPGRSHMPQSN